MDSPETGEQEALSEEEKAIHEKIWAIEEVQNLAVRNRPRKILVFTRIHEVPEEESPYYRIVVHEMYPSGIPGRYTYRVHSEKGTIEIKNKLTGDYEPAS